MSRMVRYLVLMVFLALGAGQLQAGAAADHDMGVESGRQFGSLGPNPMHPVFKLLDDRGEVIRHGARAPDQIRTCGQCHATDFITRHSLPGHASGQSSGPGCIMCHYEGGKANWTSDAFDPDGMLKRGWVRISRPAVSNCGGCHGLIDSPGGSVSVPGDYRSAAYPPGKK